MDFSAELIGVKTMATGALRITFDVPEVAKQQVMASILNFENKALRLSVNVDGVVMKDRIDNRMATNEQKTKIHMQIKDVAELYKQDFETAKTKVKATFLGNKEISIADISFEQANGLIEKLNELIAKGEKDG